MALNACFDIQPAVIINVCRHSCKLLVIFVWL